MKKGILTFVILLSLIGCANQPKNDSQEININSTQDGSKVSQKNNSDKERELAVVKAKIYSKHMYMSKDAIYKQLTADHGDAYTEDTATYAIENINVDYNKNALKKAKFYRNNKNMSIEEIKEKLSSKQGDKFTEEEAMFAIDNLE